MRRSLSPIALLALAHCTTTAAQGRSSATPAHAVAPRVGAERATDASVEPATCDGASVSAPEGARPVEDPPLLALAVGAPDVGKLCAATVFEATRPITVYRVWQRDRAFTERGRWWSLSRPTVTRERYRADNVICPEWSALDVLSQCTLRAGARFAMGPGQSVRCADGQRLPRAATLQVFIDNDARQSRMFVEDCRELGPFQ